MIVITIDFLRSNLSPKFPKKAPPKGRIIKVTTYAAKVASNANVGLASGKNRSLINGITNNIKTKSYPSRD